MKAKKIKENPITYFRKANEARKNAVKKSLKKAQAGIVFKGSQLAKEYEKAPMVGAEPEWSALALERENAMKGPRAAWDAYLSPYNAKEQITSGKWMAGSNVQNDPRFSKANEIYNDFFNKEKKEGTLYKKGINKRKDAYAPINKNPKTGKYSYNTFSSNLKKGGVVKSKKKK